MSGFLFWIRSRPLRLTSVFCALCAIHQPRCASQELFFGSECTLRKQEDTAVLFTCCVFMYLT